MEDAFPSGETHPAPHVAAAVSHQPATQANEAPPDDSSVRAPSPAPAPESNIPPPIVSDPPPPPPPDPNATPMFSHLPYGVVPGVGSGWSAMARIVREVDEEKVRDYKEDIDTILVFVST